VDDGNIVHPLDCLGASLGDDRREAVVAVGLGKSNAEIGRELYMSVATVKAHVSRVLEKLELNNRVQIALLAHAGEA
jgi:DNA-binding NarL/FixJ family response regulator